MSSTSDPSHALTKTVSDLFAAEEDAWYLSNRSRHIKPVRKPELVSYSIRTVNSWMGKESSVIATSVDTIPCVVIRSMPASEYPKYMSHLFRFTVASLVNTHPALASSMSQPSVLRVIAVTVAIRAGVWSAMSIVPVVGDAAACDALHYDKKRNALWIKSPASDKHVQRWINAYKSTTTALGHEEEIMGHLCAVAPMLMCMGATMLTQRGEVYALPYVEKSLSQCLKQRLSKDAYANLKLDRDITWDTMRNAAVSGLPMAAVRCWATDPLVAAGAQKRMSSTSAELARHVAREEALSMGAATPGISAVLDDDDDDDAEDPLVAQIRAMKSAAGLSKPEDDAVSLPTNFGSPEREFAEPSTGMPTAVPSRSQSPVPAIGQTHRDQIRAAIQNAASSGERAASELAFANADESVKW